ncbi:MAG: hypothetical protein FWC78_08235, partial [Defluviitaleaceae bacterium]|nr:hypothetical protein [Defluviitaleaceae bacterium]
SHKPSSLKTLRTASARRFSAPRLAKNFPRSMRMFLGGAAIKFQPPNFCGLFLVYNNSLL